MTPISLYDHVSLTANSTGILSLTCRWTHGVESHRIGRGAARGGFWETLPPPEDNLALRGAALLRGLAGVRSGADVVLIKRIPAAAGLGGASSDAAAVLMAANVAWQLGWTRRQLAEVGAQLGSDVPFFFHGRACLCRGRGERIEAVDGLARLHLVVVRPPGGLATAAVYRQCVPAVRPRRPDELLNAARAGDATQVGRWLFNRLEEPAARLSLWIARVRTAIQRLDCLGCQMSGSGTSFVAVCRHARHARRVAASLRASGLTAAYAVTTCQRAVAND